VLTVYFCSVAAAEGYNKSQSDRLCVVMTTSGPGATNLATGIASAWRDGVPLIVITSQVGLEYSCPADQCCCLCCCGTTNHSEELAQPLKRMPVCSVDTPIRGCTLSSSYSTCYCLMAAAVRNSMGLLLLMDGPKSHGWVQVRQFHKVVALMPSDWLSIGAMLAACLAGGRYLLTRRARQPSRRSLCVRCTSPLLKAPLVSQTPPRWAKAAGLSTGLSSSVLPGCAACNSPSIVLQML